MGIAWLAFRENVDGRLLVGAFAILSGAVVHSWQGHATFDRGAVLIALACLCWGIDNNLTRKLSSTDPVQIAMLKGLLMCAVAYTLLVIALLGQHGRDSGFARALGSDMKGKISLACYAAAIPLAFWQPLLSLAFIAVVALIWIVPDRRFAKEE